jgi:flagellar capping protein FliD
MTSLVQYTNGTGDVQNLASLGIELSATGQMSFDSSKLEALTDSQLHDALGFLGSATTGLGQLQSSFTQISDPISGTIKAQTDQFDATNKRLTDQISTLTDRINAMQAGLQLQLSAADSLIASLNSQQSLLTSSIQSLNFSSFGYNSTAPTSSSSG